MNDIAQFYVCKQTLSIRLCVKHQDLESGLCVVKFGNRKKDELGDKIDWTKGEVVPLLQVMPDIRAAYELLKRYASS